VSLGASDSEVVLIPLGVGVRKWLTPRTVTECTRQQVSNVFSVQSATKSALVHVKRPN
jgi:hypothetical protein